MSDPTACIWVSHHSLQTGFPASAPEPGKEGGDAFPEPWAGLQVSLSPVALSVVFRVKSLQTKHSVAVEYSDAGKLAVIAVPAAWGRQRSDRMRPALFLPAPPSYPWLPRLVCSPFLSQEGPLLKGAVGHIAFVLWQ